MKAKKVLLACAVAVLAAGVANADDVWLKNNANVRADRSPAADTVVELLQGAQVQQLQRQGNWVQIQANGKTGWVSADSISIRPVKANTGLPGAKPDVQMGSAAATKGWDVMATKFAQNQHLSEAGLNQMAQIKKSVTQQMLDDFMVAGHVGTKQSTSAPPAPAPPAPARSPSASPSSATPAR